MGHNNWGILTFATLEMLSLSVLQNRHCLSMDGTFRMAQQPYTVSDHPRHVPRLCRTPIALCIMVSKTGRIPSRAAASDTTGDFDPRTSWWTLRRALSPASKLSSHDAERPLATSITLTACGVPCRDCDRWPNTVTVLTSRSSHDYGTWIPVRQNFHLLCTRGLTRRLIQNIPHVDDWLD